MNNHIPANEELSALYRSSRTTVEGFDAETLLAYLDGDLSIERRASVEQRLSGSPATRSLLAMLAELQPASMALADNVAAHHASRHAIAQRAPRRVAIARPRRAATWFGAIAASALAVIAIFAFHGGQQSVDSGMAADMPARSDQIFAMREDRIFKPEMGNIGSPARESAGDRVFDSSFTKGG